MTVENNNHKFNKNFKKFNVKKSLIKFFKLKEQLNNEFRSYIRKNLLNSWLLKLYLIFKLNQTNIIKKNLRSNHKFNYLLNYSFNFDNILNNIIINKFKTLNKKHTEMKLEEFSKSKNELKIKNLKFKFN